MSIQQRADRLGFRQEERDGTTTFHSGRMGGVSLSDLAQLEREIRREIANEVSPAPVKRATFHPFMSEASKLRHREEACRERIKSFQRQLEGRSVIPRADLESALDNAKSDLTAVHARLAEKGIATI